MASASARNRQSKTFKHPSTCLSCAIRAVQRIISRSSTASGRYSKRTLRSHRTETTNTRASFNSIKRLAAAGSKASKCERIAKQEFLSGSRFRLSLGGGDFFDDGIKMALPKQVPCGRKMKPVVSVFPSEETIRIGACGPEIDEVCPQP